MDNVTALEWRNNIMNLYGKKKEPMKKTTKKTEVKKPAAKRKVILATIGKKDLHEVKRHLDAAVRIMKKIGAKHV